MRKVYNFVFLALASLVVLPASIEAATPIGDRDNCSISNPYYDSDVFVTPHANASSTSQSLIYDIVNVDVKDDTLYLYGWAFNSAINTTLDGSNAKIEFALHPKDGGEDIPFEVAYASPSGASCYGNGCGGTGGAPKYYDLTYWNCYRTSRGTTSNINGTNYETGGYCQAGERNSPQLTGGFRASINLADEKIKANSQYIVKMKFTHSDPRNTISSNWQDAAAAKAVAFDNVFEYEGTDEKKISISGFSETAQVIVGSGRPIGASGLYCNSSIAQEYGIATGAKVHYQQTSGFPIQDERGQTQFGCRGGSQRCPGGLGAGSIRLYRIYYTLDLRSNKAKPAAAAGGRSDLVPASWLKFGGNITISTGAGEVEVPEIPDPPECEDEEIYYFYYFFLAGLSDNYSGRMNTSAQGANFNDDEILRQLGFQSNAEQKTAHGIYPITKDNLDWYYDKLKLAASSSRRWANEGNKYYIAYNSWCRTDEAGNATTCYDAVTGCELDRNGNMVGTNCTADEISRGSFDKEEYKRATVNVDMPTDSRDALEIKKVDAQSGLGYRFTVSRFFKAYPGGRPSMMNTAVKAIHTTNNSPELHPAVYQISFCKAPDEPDCSDNVQTAECTSGDEGSEMIFKENDDKTICTLEHGTHSGFTIIEPEETDSYCTVACKEDLRGELPSAKETAAGQYFLLDNYIPKIEAKRTCVTNQIKKYSEFDQELQNDEKNLMTLYNTWKDWVKINGPMDGSGYTSGLSTIDGPNQIASGDCTQTTFTGTYTNGIPDTRTDIVGSYITYEWKINSSRGPNSSSSALGGATYGGNQGTFTVVSGSAGDSCTPTPDLSKQTYDADITAQMQQAEQAYRAALTAYTNKINTYNLCFNWTDNTSNLSVSGRYTVNTHPDTTYRDNYMYSFEPKVSFYYPDRDGGIFPVAYTYKYNTRDVDKEGFDTSNVYWPEGTVIDNMYNEGGQKTTGLQNRGLNKEDRTVLNCQGDTCNESSTKPSYFYSSAYIRRDEEVKYTYHLPDVFTSVPSGRVTISPDNGTFLQLDPEAVPVNVNTPAGTYDYTISVTDIKDRLRLSKESNNPDDDWDDRFVTELALNAGEDYVCTYDVINDIYIPTPEGDERFNFFYRVVDTYDINPLGRTLGYNWSDGRGDQVQEVIREDAMNYQTLTNSPDRDKFQYTLTPVAMQEIRKYNAKQNIADDGYADWDLHCDDYPEGGYHCYSNFLTCLASGEQGINEVGFKSCSSIFGTSLYNYSNLSDYDLGDLRANRQLIIDKQNALDGRGN